LDAEKNSDGRLFATDVSAKFKVHDTKTKTNIKNPARKKLDIM